MEEGADLREAEEFGRVLLEIEFEHDLFFLTAADVAE